MVKFVNYLYVETYYWDENSFVDIDDPYSWVIK